MIDASHIKVHPHAAVAYVGDQAWTHKRGHNSKISLAVDAHGLPIGIFVETGIIADCSQACRLVGGVAAEYLFGAQGI